MYKRQTKGFYQVFFSYNRDLIRGIGKGQFASYDMLMTIAPGMILTLLSFFINATYQMCIRDSSARVRFAQNRPSAFEV